jgi:hypothetical protein
LNDGRAFRSSRSRADFDVNIDVDVNATTSGRRITTTSAWLIPHVPASVSELRHIVTNGFVFDQAVIISPAICWPRGRCADPWHKAHSGCFLGFVV